MKDKPSVLTVDAWAGLVRECPFLTVLRPPRHEPTVGVIASASANTLTVYLYERITDLRRRALFVGMCERWWWSGDRTVPPDVWWGIRFSIFREALVGLPRRGTEILAGRHPPEPRRPARWRSVSAQAAAQAASDRPAEDAPPAPPAGHRQGRDSS